MYNRPYSDKVAVAADQKKDEKEYWLNTLSGDLVKSYFPFDFHKGGWNKGDIGSIQLKFPDELFHRLMKMTGNSEIRLNVVLVAAVFALLEKYTGNEDIIIGTPIARQDADVEFINTVLTLRKGVRPDVTFKKLILETGQVILEASKNQNYPIERLLYELNMKFSENEVFPLFDVAVLLENIHERRYLRHINTNVVFSFLKNENRMTGTVEYNSAVFTGRTIERIGAHYLNLLREAAFNVDTPVAEIDFLSEEEKKELLVDFNDSSADYPKNKTVVQLFREQVQKSPDNVALVFEDKRLTYKKLDEMSNQLGRLLRSKGVGVDVPVGIMVERSLEMVVGIFGVLKAGGAYVPVSPDAPLNRLTYVFDNANIKIVLTQEKYTVDYVGLYDLILLDSAVSYSGPVEDLENINTSDDLAYVIYTSGSTGKPKGVMIRHSSVVNIVKWFARKYDLKIGFNLLQMFEYTFDASVNQVFGSMLHGVTLHIISKENFFDIEFLRDYITDNFINLINFVQSVIKELLCGREKLESLEHVISGAEKLKSSVKNEILDHGYSLYNQYGPTEVTVDALAEKCSRESDGTVGIPVDNAQCYIVNKFGRLNPVGVAGELWVSGDGLARGYINNVELTALKFIPNPFSPGTRVYKTGDLTRWLPAGNVEFLGRIDSQVKIRGFRIEPVEIANQLVKIDGIKEAVVIDREDGSGDTYLCAYLVGAREIDTNEIKGLLAQHLPDYMVPTGFVWIEQLPLSGHGKLIRSALPAPDITSGSSEAYVAPANPLEEKLVDIWAGVLNIDRQIIGVNSDFFELGGHSLKAVILNSRIHKELDVRVPLTEVFRTPTVKGLAEYVKKAAKDIYLSLEAVEKKEYYPLSSAQKRIYILYRMEPQSIAYNMYRVIPLGVSVDKRQLENVCRELINRHESLRTSFHMIDETPVQKVHDNVEFNVEYYDLAGKTLALGIQDFVRAFDFSTAPLLRGRVVKTGEGQHYLLVDMHHIISDGSSRVILDQDISALYQGEKLPPLKLQYKDFSQWQNNERESERFKRQEEYWLKEFADEIPVLDLPTDYPRPAIQSFDGSSIDSELNPGITRSLTEYARNEGVTLYMMLLAAANILLSKLSGREDIVFGVPVAGRGHADLEQVVGVFVNTLALRNYPAAEKTFKAFLGELKDRTLNAFENQEYQFEDLVEKAAPQRNPSRNPLFDVMLVLQNFDVPAAGRQKNEGGASENYEDIFQVVKFDLTIYAEERERGLFLSFQYCTKLFKKETIERFIVYFKKIISIVVKRPGVRISEIAIISEEEKKQILFDFNNTKKKIVKDKNYFQLFEEQVARDPYKIAAVYNDKHVTYSELNEEAGLIGYFLSEHGVGANTIVALYIKRSIKMLASIIGVFKAGGAYLPIEMDYPENRIEYMLEDSEVNVVLCETDSLDIVNKMQVSSSCLDHEKRFESVGRVDPLKFPRENSHPDDLAYMIYTSGTTGKPKGVMIHQLGMLNHLYGMIDDLSVSAEDIIAQTASACFDISVWQFLTALLTGGRTFIISKDIVMEPRELLQVLRKGKVTILESVPSLMTAFLETAAYENEKALNRLRWMIPTGEPLGAPLARQWYRCYPDIMLLNAYGPTEASDDVTLYIVDEVPSETQTTVPIGKPLQNLHVYILDKHLSLCPVGVRGEICVAGLGVGKGYWKDIEKTRQSFISNPYLEDIGDMDFVSLYKTGDIGYFREDGNIECLGRLDDQVKIRGNRIQTGEIERQLLNLDEIKEAVVMVKKGEKGDKYLCAYVVAQAPHSPGAPDLREYLRTHLPDYMIPTVFMTIEKIPLTSNGKVDRKNLPEPEIKAREAHIAPRNDVEEKLAGIWAEILGIEKDIISMDSNFFELGGQSLKAVIMVTKIHKELNCVVALTEIFKAPTIEGIASLIDIIDWAENKESETISDVQQREEIEL